MKRLSLNILLLFVISNFCIAQSPKQQIEALTQLIETTQDDSIKIDSYQKLSELYEDGQPKKSLVYSHQSLALLLQSDYKKNELINAYIYLAELHYYAKSPLDSSFKYTKLVEVEIETIEDFSQQIDSYLKLAQLYKILEDNNDKALETNFKALRLSKEAKNIEAEARVLNYIGSILFKENNLKEALKYYKQAAALEKEGSIGKAYDFLNIGSVYERFEQIDTAHIFYRHASAIFEKTDNKIGKMITLIYSGNYHDYKGEHKKAYPKYVEADNLIRKSKAQYLYPTMDRAWANHYFLTKKYNKAIDYGTKALRVFKKQKNEYTIKDLYEILSESYAEMNDFSKAFELQKEYIIFKDSIETFELSSKVDELQAKLTTVEKEKENELLKAEKNAYQKTIQSRNATAIALILGLLLIGSWAIVVYRNNRRKQKYNEELEEIVTERTSELQISNKNLEQANYELRTFNYIASHDIKEPIRNIGNYAGLIFRKLPNNLRIDLGDYFKTIKNSTTQLYTLIEDFAKYTTLSKDDTIEKQNVDLNELLNGIEKALSGTIKKYNGVVINKGLPNISSSSSLLYTTLKNLIENGLKYNQSTTPTVEISYNKTETHHQIIVSDNGIGIAEEYHDKIFEMFKRLHNRGEYEGSGIGLAIVKLSVEKLNGEIEIKSEIGKGSTFIIALPIK